MLTLFIALVVNVDGKHDADDVHATIDKSHGSGVESTLLHDGSMAYLQH